MIAVLTMLLLWLWVVTIRIAILGFNDLNKEGEADELDKFHFILMLIPIIGSIILIMAFTEILKDELNK